MSDEQATTVGQEGLDPTPAPTPVPEQATQPESQPVPFVTEMTVMLPASKKDFLVKKLKAGKYYAAQKIYADWVSELMAIALKSQRDLGAAVDAEGKVDADKIMAQMNAEQEKSLSMLLTATASASQKQMELIAVSLGLTVEEIEEQFYPEDMNVLLTAVCKVNGFADNLKKSVAPMVSLVA